MDSGKTKKRKKKSFEIRFCEELVKECPRFAAALDCLGTEYTRCGFYEEGLRVDERLVSLKPEEPFVWYNLGCSYSLLGRLEESLEALRKAVDLGYADFRHMFRDEDLANVRATEEFKALMRRIRDERTARRNA
jgi:tetratricopeptide (TPR) repeat protein